MNSNLEIRISNSHYCLITEKNNKKKSIVNIKEAIYMSAIFSITSN